MATYAERRRYPWILRRICGYYLSDACKADQRDTFDRINRSTDKRFQGGVYACRKNETRKKLDGVAMLKASKALVHNRMDVMANNYLRAL